MLKQPKIQAKYESELKNKINASHDWDNLSTDQMYQEFLMIILSTAQQVLGSTRAKAKPTSTDEL